MPLTNDEKQAYKTDHPDMPTSALKAIRANCLDCMGGNPNEVRLCNQRGRCSLWPFRFGKSLIVVNLSADERKIYAERAKKNWGIK
jgi:hypothetical protein